MTRREEREIAFALCFEMELTKEPAENVIAGAIEIREAEVPVFCGRIVRGVEKHGAELDERIGANIRKGWRLERISKVSLSILRVALYEMLYEEDVPESVSINEAVELAKIYGDADAPAFVNGVLASISKSREAE